MRQLRDRARPARRPARIRQCALALHCPLRVRVDPVLRARAFAQQFLLALAHEWRGDAAERLRIPVGARAERTCGLRSAPGRACRPSRPARSVRRRLRGRRAGRARASPPRTRAARSPRGRGAGSPARAAAARAAGSRRQRLRPQAALLIDVARRLRSARSARSGRTSTTTGNSRPLALCTVMMRTPSVPSSTIGASLPRPSLGCCIEPLDEAAERQRALRIEARAPCRRRGAVGERLLAGRPDRDAGVRARRRRAGA